MNEQTDTIGAGFWLRVCAYMIDAICMVVISGVINLCLVGTFFSMDPQPSGNSLWASLFSFVAGFLYFSFFQRHFSATVGKKVLGITLVDAKTFKQISIGQCVGRYFMLVFSSLCFCLGLMAVGWNKNKKGWHDSIAGTRVVKRKQLEQYFSHENHNRPVVSQKKVA